MSFSEGSGKIWEADELFVNGSYSEALLFYQRLLSQINSDDPISNRILVNMGAGFALLGDFNQSIDLLNQVASQTERTDPFHRMAYQNIAGVYLTAEDYEQALYWYNHVLMLIFEARFSLQDSSLSYNFAQKLSLSSEVRDVCSHILSFFSK